MVVVVGFLLGAMGVNAMPSWPFTNWPNKHLSNASQPFHAVTSQECLGKIEIIRPPLPPIKKQTNKRAKMGRFYDQKNNSLTGTERQKQIRKTKKRRTTMMMMMKNVFCIFVCCLVELPPPTATFGNILHTHTQAKDKIAKISE